MGNLRPPPQNSDGDCSEWQGHDRKRSSGVKVGLEMIIWGDGSDNKVFITQT